MKKFIMHFAENLTFKIISVILAVFLWFFVTFKGQTETTVDVPVEFKNVPSNMEILKQSIKKTSVTISTRERMLKELSQKDIRVVLDLSNIRLGENSIPITKSSVKIPRGVEISKIDPSILKLYIDEKTEKIVPVRVRFIGNPAKGVSIKSVNVMPSTIRIEGPKKELDRIRFLKTEPVDIDGIQEDLKVQAKIDPEGRIFRTDTDTVSIEIKIGRR